MITIVYCHPGDKSFNHSILQSITDRLTGEGREYDVINLYAEGFDPVLGRPTVAGDTRRRSDEALVRRYQDALFHTDQIVFIFPIWWGMMPAMLKGWIDKVFAKGIIYDTTPEGALMPCLSIDRTTLITTSEEPSEIIAPFIDGYFTPQVLNTVGMNGVRWFNCSNTTAGGNDHRQEFINTVVESIIK